MNVKHHLRQLAVAIAVLLLLAVAATAGNARALNPNQTSVTTIVNTVYGDLDDYWIPIRRAGVAYYDFYSSGVLVDYWTSCQHTSTAHGWEGFYCPTNEAIYFDYNQQVGNVRSFGDGSTAFWTAHEYGHHVEKLLGIDWRAPYNELLADCLAGMYFRHGVYTSGWLAVGDYGEARNQIWALTGPDPVHGTREQRLRAFDFGFRQELNRNICIDGAGVNY
jgi:predicted metalloprotease